MASGKVWFITGTSTGIGRALAEELLAAGHSVVATARNPESLADLAGATPDRLAAVRLDVTSPEEITAAVDAAIARFGRIDVVVNNAGYGLIGALEEVDDADVRLSFETQVFGVLNIIRAALPHLRAQGSGTIVNVSSGGGLIGYPAGGIYCACKFALEGLTEALADEVRPFGIKVLLIEPGLTQSNFFVGSLKLADAMDAYANTPVGAIRSRIASRDPSDGQEPAVVARAILAAEARDDLPLRLMVGAGPDADAESKIESLTAQVAASRQFAV
ncbi:MAG: SDR family oxidoreductase [Acidimicrobiia bacterium]